MDENKHRKVRPWHYRDFKESIIGLACKANVNGRGIQNYLHVIESVVDSICDCTICEYRSETLKHSLGNAAGSYNIDCDKLQRNKKWRQKSELLEYDPQRFKLYIIQKVTLTETRLLSSKACVWQIFSGSAGTDGNTAHAILAHRGISIVDLLLNFRGKAGIHNHVSGLSASMIRTIETAQKLLTRRRRDAEATRHIDA